MARTQGTGTTPATMPDHELSTLYGLLAGLSEELLEAAEISPIG